MDLEERTRNLMYDLDELKSLVDFTSIASQFISLDKGRRLKKGLCPFHDDVNTKSFHIYPEGVAHCFGCGWHGDVIKFVKDIQNTSWGQAIRWVASQVGSVPEATIEKEERIINTTPIPLEIIDYWHKTLLTNELRQYLYDRLLADKTIDLYHIGWDGGGYTIPHWEGLPGKSDVLSYKVRRMNAKPKYWQPGNRAVPRLFNKWVLQEEEAFLFFGEFDCLLAWQDGLPAVSLTCGQNSWLPSFAKYFDSIVNRYVVPDVGELVAGYKAASDINANVIEYPKGPWTDYTDFRLAGASVLDFRRLLLTQEYEVETQAYWERN